MRTLFNRGCFTVLSFKAGLIGSILANDSHNRYTEEDPLLPKSHSYTQLPSKTPKGKPKKNTSSKSFCIRVNNLAKAFENFELLSSTEREELLNEWKTEYLDLKIGVFLYRHTAMSNFDVSPDTMKKFEGVKDLYSPQKMKPCTIF